MATRVVEEGQLPLPGRQFNFNYDTYKRRRFQLTSPPGLAGLLITETEQQIEAQYAQLVSLQVETCPA